MSCDVVVLGEALADLFPDGPVLGGAPFNVARNLAALGGEASIVSRVGRDAIGTAIAAECRRFGLPVDGLQHDPTRPSGTVAVSFEDGAHRFHIGPDQAWDALEADDAVSFVRQAAPKLICFGTLAQRTPVSRSAVRAALQASAALRVLDLNLRGGDDPVVATESLQLADVVKVNEAELAQVLAWTAPAVPVPPCDSSEHPVAIARLMRRFELRLLVVTRGAAGCTAFDAECGRIVHGASAAVTVHDTVGAGDAFTAVLLLGWVRGWPLARTLEHAGMFASSVCTLRGAVSADLAFYSAERAKWAA